MARALPYYPPGPRNVPDDLTEPGEAYKVRVFLVLLSLVAFFGIYVGVLFGSLLFAALALLLAPFVLKLPLAGFFFLCFVFLLKPFFRRRPKERSFYAEIDSTEHPRLHAFIRQLCRETGAEFPHRLYLSWDVNAAVFYDDSLRCLFLPTPKNLRIGLGLLNVLNLSEFKAVVAHEFGHFTQKSMRLDSYVYVANRYLVELVAGRDWLDDVVLRLRRYRNAVGLLATAFWGVFWLIRRAMYGCYRGITFLSLALGREMEYHADRVAAAAAGSDAIVHGLYRIEFANEALGQAAAELRTAAQHDLYTSDLFYHQTRAADYLRRVRDDPTLGEPPPVPDGEGPPDDLFTEEEHGQSSAWSTHPSLYEREQGVKEVYLRAPLDERSPWLLFDDVQAVRERVTRRFYRCVYDLDRDAERESAERVQAFIDAEHAETTYDKRYHGAYDGRRIAPGVVEALADEVKRSPWKADVLGRNYRKLFGPELRERAHEYLLLCKEKDTLDQVQADASRGKVQAFLFRDRTYRPASLKRLTRKVLEHRDVEWRWLAARDKMVFLVHYQMARDVGRETAAELLSRYQFHLQLQQISIALENQQGALQGVLTFLRNSQSSSLPQSVFAGLRDRLRTVHAELDRCLRLGDRLRLPRLENMEERQPLSDFLMPRALLKGLRPTASSLQFKWVDKLWRQLAEVRQKVARIHFKSLGAILALQERVAQQWTTELADVPELVLAEDEPEATAEEQRAAAARRNTALAESDDEAEFELSEADVMDDGAAPPSRPEIELEELDADGQTERPRHWDA